MEADELFSPDEAEQRLHKTLKAAFNMKPIPLKAIPKRNGESRRAAKKAASAASAKSARP
jgi:hypothetical protein